MPRQLRGMNKARQRRSVSRVLSPERVTQGDGHFSRTPVARRLERPYPRARTGRPIALLFGLAPGGVCLADAVTRAAGELLPHRFTLTAPPPRGAKKGGGLFLWHFPWGCPPWPLASTLPCGARTFLPPCCHGRRPSDLLWRVHQYSPRRITGAAAAASPEHGQRDGGGGEEHDGGGETWAARRRFTGTGC